MNYRLVEAEKTKANHYWNESVRGKKYSSPKSLFGCYFLKIFASFSSFFLCFALYLPPFSETEQEPATLCEQGHCSGDCTAELIDSDRLKPVCVSSRTSKDLDNLKCLLCLWPELCLGEGTSVSWENKRSPLQQTVNDALRLFLFVVAIS